MRDIDTRTGQRNGKSGRPMLCTNEIKIHMNFIAQKNRQNWDMQKERHVQQSVRSERL